MTTASYEQYKTHKKRKRKKTQTQYIYQSIGNESQNIKLNMAHSKRMMLRRYNKTKTYFNKNKKKCQSHNNPWIATAVQMTTK